MDLDRKNENDILFLSVMRCTLTLLVKAIEIVGKPRSAFSSVLDDLKSFDTELDMQHSMSLFCMLSELVEQ